VAEQRVEGAVTVLFTDVEGSTDMRTRLGDEIADELLRLHEDIVRERVTKHGGREIKALGDGFMVAFTSPRKAISCAVEIQRALDDRNRSSPGREMRVRIGINAGEVSEKAGDLFGAAVNAAARIAGKARGGQILIANVVKDLAGLRPDLSYVDRGLFWLKGFPERWRLFEVARQASGPMQERAAPAHRKTEFVGRDAERADLRHHVENAGAGRGSLVMIGGEPGVGKTRITEEISEEAASHRLLSLVGHCYETEAPVPYAPVAEIFEATARVVSRGTLWEALGDTGPEIARIMPELRRIFPDLPPPIELPPEQERRYLFNSVTEFVSRAARMQPLLLVLEDLHWADEPTLLLIQHLAERLSDIPILIVGTYRDVELDVDRPLARALESLVRRRLVHRIALSRLPKDGVEAMLRAMAGRDVPPTLVDAVHEETEGNCFFVEEVFQHLLEEGKLFDQAGEWRTEVRIGEVDVPEGVRLVLGRRLGRLSEGARRALGGAAVIGRNFTFELVDALGEVSTDALLDGIEEAHRARLLSSNEDAFQARFTFSHELIRQTLLTGLSLPRRQRLHLRVAEAIERVHARNLDAHIADLAHHLYQAGAAADPEKGARYLTLAGDRAMEGAGFEDALRAYERAGSLVPDGDARGRADLDVKHGFALRALNRNDEALAVWRRALDAYAELGDGNAAAQVCWEIGTQLGWAGYPVESMEFLQRGLMVAGEGSASVRGRLLALAGGIFGYLGDLEGGNGMLDEALAIADQDDDDALRADVAVSRAVINYSHMEHATIVAESATDEALIRSVAAPWDQASYLTLLMWSLLSTGRVADGRAMAEEVEPLAARMGHFTAQLLAERMFGVMAYRPTGDLDVFEAFARHDLERCKEADAAWISNSYGFLTVIDLWRGRLDAALANATLAVDTEPPGGFNGWSWPLLFFANIHSGNRDAAMQMYADAKDRLPKPGSPAPWGSWAIAFAAAEGLAVLGEREASAELYPIILEARRTGSLFARIYEVRLDSTVAGIAAHAARLWEESESHFTESLGVADETAVRIEQGESRYFFAQMLAERDRPGDRERARQLAEEANEIYREVGMPLHSERAETLLKSL
jgi:class 3 adenylate cyclase/tetratricopeptide (TPR) repeat protein